MTSTAYSDSSAKTSPASGSEGVLLARVAVRREIGLVLFLFAVLQQSLGQQNPDNSWLLTVCERLLGGDRIYSDIYEQIRRLPS